MRLKHFILTAIALVALAASAQTTIEDLEQNIKLQEAIASEKQDSIRELDEQIKVLKLRMDSLNKETRAVKEQISALEKTRKGHENDIKLAGKARSESFASRDNLVYEQEVAGILSYPYDKESIDNVLPTFDGMETREVLKRKELVENYGDYNKNLREFLEKQKILLAADGWALLTPKDEAYKKFMKGLKSTKYWKTYDKRSSEASIPYLDEVMDQLMQQAANGLANSRRFDEIINMLY